MASDIPTRPVAAWEVDSPLKPLPTPPLGVNADFTALPFKVTPETVRLGRWLFFDTRLSKDNTVSCATCHKPENAFSETTPVSTGVGGNKGQRKAMSFLNGAWPLFPVFFWDGRVSSLVEQAKAPVVNPMEMGNTHEAVVKTVAAIAGYRKHFKEAFGDEQVSMDRIAEAISAFEATCLSGNSKHDRYEAGDNHAFTPQEKHGRDLFLVRARCARCHVTGGNFTDSMFHNIGIGWNEEKAKASRAKKGIGLAKAAFVDLGRYEVTKKKGDIGAFKTPSLRDVSKHAPYMHDGSIATLKEVVELYNRGGHKNPWLDAQMTPLYLSADDVDALVAYLHALDGEGYYDPGPKSFPQ